MENNEYFASINEVSKRLNVPAHTLRYWEKQFPVAVRPTTGAGGRRYYRTETVNKLIVIKDLLYTHGLTIAGVKKLLRDGNLPSSADELLTGGAVNSDAISVPVSHQLSNTSEIDTVISLLESAKSILQ
ncbi:MAG: MerR family transcriptional regulator [Alphaproteobacteria bacterium]|nr:MerR family transcriptional regulator [Alphaproteobacteria bacterium]